MFWCKIFSAKGQVVVAICDKNLLGKKIGKNPTIVIRKDFYGGELIDDNKALEMMKRSNICNLMGKNIVNIAIQKKFITKENIIFIDEIPHAQFIK
ncbi:MAG: hypothetical protein AYK18_02885 [Theionarchaea archaeon DG-70]|nr:MAG: hypothetical protein AYK18_02885 [Theionarchaea archaeon DG-70]